MADHENKEEFQNKAFLKEEHVPVIWKIFGGAVLSIIFLLTITLFGYVINQVNNAQAAVNSLNGEVIKKPEFNDRNSSIWSSLKSVDGIKEKCGATDRQVDKLEAKISLMEKAIEATNKELVAAKERNAGLEKNIIQLHEDNRNQNKDLQSLRERIAAVEGRKSP